MPFVPSIAGPVDGTTIYMAWLVVDVFLLLLMLLLLIKFCCCPPPLSIINTPLIHISTFSSSWWMPLDDERCQGIVICAAAAAVVIGARTSKGRPTMPRHRHPSRRCRHHLGERGTADKA
jgi:hypothetical protein